MQIDGNGGDSIPASGGDLGSVAVSVPTEQTPLKVQSINLNSVSGTDGSNPQTTGGHHGGCSSHDSSQYSDRIKQQLTQLGLVATTAPSMVKLFSSLCKHPGRVANCNARGCTANGGSSVEFIITDFLFSIQMHTLIIANTTVKNLIITS